MNHVETPLLDETIGYNFKKWQIDVVSLNISQDVCSKSERRFVMQRFYKEKQGITRSNIWLQNLMYFVTRLWLYHILTI